MFLIIQQLADVTDRFRHQIPYLPRALQLVQHAAGGWGDENHQKTGFKLIPFLFLVI